MIMLFPVYLYCTLWLCFFLYQSLTLHSMIMNYLLAIASHDIANTAVLYLFRALIKEALNKANKLKSLFVIY